MPTTVYLTVRVIGWNPRSGEPRWLQPQFDHPVDARIYTDDGVRHAPAWLRVDGLRIIAVVPLPDELDGRRVRCFCCTQREYEPLTHLERRRITSVDVVLEYESK